MKYKHENLMPKRYPQNKPKVTSAQYLVYIKDYYEKDGWYQWWFYEDGIGYGYKESWDRHVEWFIDIPFPPEKIRPLPYPENKPEKDGTYFVHDKTDSWIGYEYLIDEFPGVDYFVDYFIDIRLEDLESEGESMDEITTVVDMKNGEPTISNISAKQYYIEQLEKMGFEVELTKREPEIAPCPNPKCDATIIYREHPRVEEDEMRLYRVACNCGYRGPWHITIEGAIVGHNLLCEEK